MGILSNPLRSREGRQSQLPVYENVHLTSKERNSNDSYDDSDYDDYSTTSSPGTNNSRFTSASTSTATPIMPKRAFPVPRKPRQPINYRLPNKVVRYLCFGLTFFIVSMIFSLIRASHNENRALAEGRINRPPSTPPSWEQFPFLTRYYGGIRNLVPFSQNTPEYPLFKGEQPIDKLFYVNSTNLKSDVEERNLPASKEYIRYPQSVFQDAPEQFQECYIDKANKVRVPPIRYYEGRPHGFPDPVLGSYELLGLPEDICFERYGRYGPYGFRLFR